MSTLLATVSFTVPGPPVPWQRVIPVHRFGKRISVVPARTRAYERCVATAGMSARMTFAFHEVEPWPYTHAQSYRLSCCFYRGANRGDLSNFIKAIEDGLNSVLWPDDRAVRSYGPMSMPVDRANPRADVTVEAFA